jgi:hypothetical protein
MNPSATELRLQNRADRREIVHRKAEDLLGERGEDNLSDTDRKQLELYREERSMLDDEIVELLADKEANDKAAEQSRLIRQALLDQGDVDGDGPVYKTMAQYARDVILTRESTVCGEVQTQFGNKDALHAASSRLELLKRTPANTLSSDVAGLQPVQFIDQIFQVIDNSRPIVSSATRTTLVRGTLNYPKVTARPIVAVQDSEKTEAGNTGMNVDMEAATASTYLGGGDLSWQAINWSSPDALDLWFQLAAADYALKTEQDAAKVLTDSAFVDIISTTFGSTGTFATLLPALGAGAEAVYSNSGRIADTVYMAPDRYWYIFGLTSNAYAQFAAVSDSKVGPLNFVVSRGMDSGEIIVGDSKALLVAETDGAPVQLRVVEPAIGGLEVGIIGAFEAVVVDPGAFSLITTAS